MTLVAVARRHHLASTSGHPDVWLVADRPVRGHVCDLLCHDLYAQGPPPLPPRQPAVWPPR